MTSGRIAAQLFSQSLIRNFGRLFFVSLLGHCFANPTAAQNKITLIDHTRLTGCDRPLSGVQIDPSCVAINGSYCCFTSRMIVSDFDNRPHRCVEVFKGNPITSVHHERLLVQCFHWTNENLIFSRIKLKHIKRIG